MNRTQLTLTTALASAALAFACGRAEIETKPDPTLSYNLLNPAIDIPELRQHPALADYRLVNLQVARPSVPPVTLQPVPSSSSNPRPMLTEWNHSALLVSQIEFMPLILEELDGDEVVRSQVFFDAGRLVRSARWNEVDGRWNPVAGVEHVAVEQLERPLSMWSDLLGVVELADCRQDVDATWGCDARGTATIATYFPRPLELGEGPELLACLEGCPDPDGNDDAVYFDNIEDPSKQTPAEVAVFYAYDADEPMLQHHGVRVLPQKGASDYVSGFMFDASPRNIDEMACSQDDVDVYGVCSFNKQDVFYTWSTNSDLQATRRYPLVVE